MTAWTRIKGEAKLHR